MAEEIEKAKEEKVKVTPVKETEQKVAEKAIEKVEEKEEKEAKKDFEKKGKKGRYPRRRGEKTREEIVEAWIPKTKLGKEVKAKKIKDIDEILDNNRKILEGEIVDALIEVKSDLIAIGQSKGKFGGGKRRAWRQTQRKTREGNVATFSALAVVGDGNGHIGIGEGKAKETLPARDKAIRKAKLNLMRVTRSCAAFDCACSELHTVPFEVIGKAGSVQVKLIPAPQGTGLVVARELRKVLALVGIQDVYSKTSGRQRTTFNLIKACIEALKKTNARTGDKK
jgi:small subunit ribosomal protein S5